MSTNPLLVVALVGWVVVWMLVALLVSRDAASEGPVYAAVWAAVVFVSGPLGILVYDVVDSRREESDAADGDGSVWDMIPQWQYGSLHYGYAGGYTRRGQERALEEAERQAARLEAADRRSEGRRGRDAVYEDTPREDA